MTSMNPRAPGSLAELVFADPLALPSTGEDGGTGTSQAGWALG